MPHTSDCGIFLLEALKRLGAPYKWGAKGKDDHPAAPTDCSGLAYRCARLASEPIPRGTWHQYHSTGLKPISVRAALKAIGALLFIVRGGKTKHVAISLGDGVHTIEAIGSTCQHCQKRVPAGKPRCEKCGRQVRCVTICDNPARFNGARKILGLYT